MEIAPTDIAILVVSSLACIYCFVLSRRLRALQNTKDGLGAAVVALTRSISEMSQRTRETRAHAEAIANRLSESIARSEQAQKEIDDMTEIMTRSHRLAVEEVRSAQSELAAMMREVMGQSKERVIEMTRLMKDLQDATVSVQAASSPYEDYDDLLFAQESSVPVTHNV